MPAGDRVVGGVEFDEHSPVGGRVVGRVEFDEHSPMGGAIVELDGRAELDDLSPSLDVLRALELKGLYNSDGNILERSIAPGKIPHFLKPAVILLIEKAFSKGSFTTDANSFLLLYKTEGT